MPCNRGRAGHTGKGRVSRVGGFAAAGDTLLAGPRGWRASAKIESMEDGNEHEIETEMDYEIERLIRPPIICLN